MNFEHAVKKCLQHYADFSGRAGKAEYWYFVLFLALSEFVSIFLGAMIRIPYLLVIVMLMLVIPMWAVTWRRLHDIGRSGGSYFFSLIPLVGPILILIWLVEDSQPGNNQYGPGPGTVVNGYRQYVQPQGTYYVRVLSGALKGQVYPISPAGLIIGRQVGCTICYPNGTPGISGQHCQLKYLQNQLVLIDLGSSFGTFVQSGKRIPPEYPEFVGAGTVFYLADQSNMFEIYLS